MQLATMVGAIGFDPEIRGILVVLVGASVLMGSIYLILSTNMGVRTGFLVLGAGLFGWASIMCPIWVLYGIGLRGRDPAWVTTDINLSRDVEVPEVPVLAKLPAESDLPVAEDLLEKHPLLHAMALGSEGAEYKPINLTKLKTLIQPWVIAKPEDIKAVAEKALKTGTAVTDSDAAVKSLLETGGSKLDDTVHQQAREIREEIEKPLNGWCLLTESDTRRGEATSAVDAALISKKIFVSDTPTTADHIIDDVFIYGGKVPCNPVEELSSVKRAAERVWSILEIKNPPLYAAVTVTKAQNVKPADGEAPPPAAKVVGAKPVTVVMERNLGNRRLVPFEFSVMAWIMFGVFVTILHYRDKNAMSIRAAFSSAKK